MKLKERNKTQKNGINKENEGKQINKQKHKERENEEKTQKIGNKKTSHFAGQERI
jgi:hypothetical protein